MCVMRGRGSGLCRAAGGLVVCAALSAGCGGADEPAGRQVVRLSVETTPGAARFDKQHVIAAAGRIVLELTNPRRRGHNVRVHTGDVCCFRAGSRDVGGTRTIGTGRTRAVLDLEPGTYTYLCSTGGYWRTQHGTLVVR
jgi:hypothetical protein